MEPASPSASHREIVRSLTKRRPVEEAFSRLVAHCARKQPHPDWRKFTTADLAADLERVGQWLIRGFRHDPPTARLNGLWFGLCNPIDDRDGPVADVRVHAAAYDPDDREWPGYMDWQPDEYRAQSSVLAHIYRVAYRRGGLMNAAEYPLCLGYAVFALRHLLDTLPPKIVLGRAPKRVVLVGFDDGDSICVGTLRKTGLTVSPDGDTVP